MSRLCVAVFIAVSGCAFAEPLTLEEAIRLTLERNPRIASLQEAHLAASGRRIDAGAWPNPELSFEAENVRFGDGPDTNTTVRAPDDSVLERSQESVSNSGFGESELTLRVAQVIELGGKRSRRIALADESIQVALWDFEIERANAVAETRDAFIGVLAAQENLELSKRVAQLAGEASEAARVRVESGKDAPILHDRAEIEHAQARIDQAAAERALAAARYALAAQWDDREPSFDSVQGDLYRVSALPDRASLKQMLERSPHLARWSAEVVRREAALALERSNRAPDLTLSLGWRGMTLPEGDEQTFDAGALVSSSDVRPDDDWDHSIVFGVSVPLPLFQRNRGGIAEAEHLALQAGHERRAEHADAWRRVAAVHSELDAAYTAIAELREGVTPAAQRAYDAMRVGFDGGKFTYLDVLDAQRTLVSVQRQYLDACANYQRGVAELERLLGTSPVLATVERVSE